MIDWIKRTFNLYPYDIPQKRCRSCEVLEESLRFERERNTELLAYFTRIPDAPSILDTKNLRPIRSHRMPFSARRAEFERDARARAEQNIRTNSPLIAKGDLKPEIKHMASPSQSVDKLEEELGIEGVN